MPRSTASTDLRQIEPHPIYAPESPRFVSVCGCGWESHPSTFRSFALAGLDTHRHEQHGDPLPPAPRDSLAACWAESSGR